jgi:uncharacterized protein
MVFRLGDLEFRWDPQKAGANVRKHGVTFEEAATTWLDPYAIERPDPEHSADEARWLRIGASLRGALLVAWSTERVDEERVLIRVIGARRATAKEHDLYESKREY